MPNINTTINIVDEYITNSVPYINTQVSTYSSLGITTSSNWESLISYRSEIDDLKQILQAIYGDDVSSKDIMDLASKISSETSKSFTEVLSEICHSLMKGDGCWADRINRVKEEQRENKIRAQINECLKYRMEES